MIAKFNVLIGFGVFVNYTVRV